MDPMEDEDRGLKKSVIDQMMGEIDDVTADSLRKPKGPVQGVKISITVSPKTDDEMAEELEEHDADSCEDPTHDHSEDKEEEPDGDYISQLLKKLG